MRSFIWFLILFSDLLILKWTNRLTLYYSISSIFGVQLIYQWSHILLGFPSISSFVFGQQIQYGRHSSPSVLVHLKTQPALCLPSQTGLRCHSNMLWRSTYWDSAGWRVTVWAVWAFGPFSPTNILPSLTTGSTQQPTEQARFAFVSPRLYFVYVLLVGVFVCSRNATRRTFSSGVKKRGMCYGFFFKLIVLWHSQIRFNIFF